jgi:hypothetical protein
VDSLDYELLTWLEQGHTVFQPAEAGEAARQAFQQTAARILDLWGRGLIRVAAVHIRRTGSGEHLQIGPCVLSPEGRAALVNGHRAIPTPPREVCFEAQGCPPVRRHAGGDLAPGLRMGGSVGESRPWARHFSLRQRTLSPRHFEFREGQEPRESRMWAADASQGLVVGRG